MQELLVFKRNMTRLDCTKEQFTGIRHCNISGNHEIWVKGNMVKEVSETQMALDPDAVAKAYQEVFGFHSGQVQVV